MQVFEPRDAVTSPERGQPGEPGERPVLGAPLATPSGHSRAVSLPWIGGQLQEAPARIAGRSERSSAFACSDRR